MPLRSGSEFRANLATNGANRYRYSQLVASGTGSQSPLMTIAKLTNNPVIRIYRIQITLNRGATGKGFVARLGRTTLTPSGGTLIAASDIPKLDTNSPDATAVVRTGSGISLAFPLETQFYLGGCISTASKLGGPLGAWTSFDFLDEIVLRSTQAFCITSEAGSPDADDLYGITVSWEEE